MHHANRVWAFLIPSVSPLEFKSILFFESMTIMTTTEDRWRGSLHFFQPASVRTEVMGHSRQA